MHEHTDRCDACGEETTDLDAGFCPSALGMTHACGGRWSADPGDGAHRHRPKTTREEPWIYCVARHDVETKAGHVEHGGRVIVDACRCGATRRSEANAGQVAYGPWVVK